MCRKVRALGWLEFEEMAAHIPEKKLIMDATPHSLKDIELKGNDELIHKLATTNEEVYKPQKPATSTPSTTTTKPPGSENEGGKRPGSSRIQPTSAEGLYGGSGNGTW